MEKSEGWNNAWGCKCITYDLKILPQGKRYEDTYGQWLEFFKEIATTDKSTKIQVDNAPASWIALLQYMGCRTQKPRDYFENDSLILALNENVYSIIPNRSALESFCTFRPETIDGLWKLDNQDDWKSNRLVELGVEKEFMVTNTATYFRPEIKTWFQWLYQYTPSKKKVVLVPCAADKPYPSKLHQAVLQRLPADWYLAIATGPLGIVPQDLWEHMPHYDAGIPNQWRVFEETREYFGKHQHDRVIAYTDFYNDALYAAFKVLEQESKISFLHDPNTYFEEHNNWDYTDLLSKENLAKLENLLQEDK